MIHDLKKTIHPFAILTAILTLFIFVFAWHNIANTNFNNAVKTSKKSILSDPKNTLSNQQLDAIFSSIKNKRTAFKTSKLSNNEISYNVRSLPFPVELIKKYSILESEHQTYCKEKEKFSEKNIEYTGFPSSLEALSQTKNRIILSWLKSIFFGLIIGFLMSLNKIIQQGIGWIFKCAFILFPAIFVSISMFFISNTSTMEDILNASLTLYATLIISYFASNRNSILTYKNKTDKDFYHKYNLGFVFTGLRISLYLLVPLCISTEILTQSIGLGTVIWENFTNASWDSNTQIILLSVLISLFAFKIDFIMLVVQYILKIKASNIAKS